MKVIEMIDAEKFGIAVLDAIASGGLHVFQFQDGIGYMDAYVYEENLIPVVDVCSISKTGMVFRFGKEALCEINKKLRDWYLS